MLTAALSLLEAESGPVLVDFTEDAPRSAHDMGPLACPVNFAPRFEEITDMDRVVAAFVQEAAQLRNWYDLAVEKRQRTTFSGAFASPEKTVAVITDTLKGKTPDLDGWEGSLAAALRMAGTDIKAFYLEAVTAQPGQPTNSASLNDWFWGETAAARAINELKRLCLQSEDPEMRVLGQVHLVPRTQAYRFES